MYFKRMFFKFDNINLQMKFISKFANLFYIEISNKPVKIIRLDSCGHISFEFNTFNKSDLYYGEVIQIDQSGKNEYVNTNLQNSNRIDMEGLLINFK